MLTYPTLLDLFSTLSALCATMVIVSHNPIHSVAFLILVFTNTTALLLCFGSQAEFLAMMFIIIYVGAIAVLFLFVVMMLNIKTDNGAEPSSLRAASYSTLLFLYCASFTLILVLPLVVLLPWSSISFASPALFEGDLNDGCRAATNAPAVCLPPLASLAPNEFANILDQAVGIGSVPLGALLYTHYFYTLLLAGIILLVAMIGAILLTMHKRSLSVAKKQLIYQQVARRFDLAISSSNSPPARTLSNQI